MLNQKNKKSFLYKKLISFIIKKETKRKRAGRIKLLEFLNLIITRELKRKSK